MHKNAYPKCVLDVFKPFPIFISEPEVSIVTLTRKGGNAIVIVGKQYKVIDSLIEM